MKWSAFEEDEKKNTNTYLHNLKHSIMILTVGGWLWPIRTGGNRTRKARSNLRHHSTARLSQIFEHRLSVMRKHVGQITRHRIVPEEIVSERRIRVHSFGRIDNQKFVQQIQSVRVFDVRFQSFFDLAFLTFFNVHFVVQVELFDAGPVIWGERSAQLTN